MADGILCKHCGHQETDHTFHYPSINRYKRLKGYKVTLSGCGRFEGEEEPERLSRFDLEVMEKRGEVRASWGMWSAYVRNQNFKRKVSEMNKIIERASDDKKRNEAQDAKKKFLDGCRSANIMGGFYIG